MTKFIHTFHFFNYLSGLLILHIPKLLQRYLLLHCNNSFLLIHGVLHFVQLLLLLLYLLLFILKLCTQSSTLTLKLQPEARDIHYVKGRTTYKTD